jgi:hypothetical protein
MLSVRLFGSQFPRAYVGSTPVRAAGLLVCVGQVAGLRCTPCLMDVRSGVAQQLPPLVASRRMSGLSVWRGA